MKRSRPKPLLVDNTEKLARIFGISAAAIRKAERFGRVHRESDGRWEVFTVAEQWRSTTDWALQRNMDRVPWLDSARQLTSDLARELGRRARAEGVRFR